jgi:hypothetical protein
VEVPDYSNAFVIFETLNDRGLDLAISDLLKNYLFHKADNRLNEVQKNWNSMTGVLESISNDSIIVPYLKYYWSSSEGSVREKELYLQIKSNIKTQQKAITFSKSICTEAINYSAIIHSDHELWSKFDIKTREHVKIINELGMVQIRPLLLSVINTFDETEISRFIKKCVSIIVRLLISRSLSSGIFEKQFSDTAIKVRNLKITDTKNVLKDLSNIVPQDTQFNEDFSSAFVSKARIARYYLIALENTKKGAKDPELIPSSDPDILNLEHILPKNPSKAWNNIKEEEVKSFYNRLGNLTLLGKEINKLVGNSSFSEKKNVYKDSSIFITKDIAKYSDWGIDEIKKRQLDLSALAIKTWPL